ncbi:MAG TPA: glycoside hydrolase family 18 protein, partial [Tahibacter sp.]|nr:glycoside hydrolase family 18 protein [Tahibacter sp.]
MSRRFVAATAALALACIAATSHAADTVFATSFERSWVSGYVVGYQRNLMPIDQVDFAAVTHLMVGRVTPNANGTINTHFDIDNVNGPIWATQAADAAHAGNAKAILMVGGAGEYNGWVGATSAQNRAAFVQNLVAAAVEYGFDGFDIDWEPLLASDVPNLVALLQDLRAAAGPGLILTMPVGWIN